MGKLTYKQRADEIANAYWAQRKIECDDEADVDDRLAARDRTRELWDAMGDLEPDPLPEWVNPEVAELADRFAMKDRSARDDLDGSPVVCRGSWPFDDGGYGIDKRLGPEWHDHEGYRNGFRAFWSNDRLHAVITYCEGDFTLDILPDEAAYRAFLGYADRFYREHA